MYAVIQRSYDYVPDNSYGGFMANVEVINQNNEEIRVRIERVNPILDIVGIDNEFILPVAALGRREQVRRKWHHDVGGKEHSKHRRGTQYYVADFFERKLDAETFIAKGHDYINLPRTIIYCLEDVQYYLRADLDSGGGVSDDAATLIGNLDEIVLRDYGYWDRQFGLMPESPDDAANKLIEKFDADFCKQFGEILCAKLK